MTIVANCLLICVCDDDICVCVKLWEEDLIALVIVKVKGGGIEIIQDEHVVRKVMVGIDQTFSSWREV